MAEIEHFVNPKDKAHPKFKHIAAKELVLFPNDDQLGSGKTRVMSIGGCVCACFVRLCMYICMYVQAPARSHCIAITLHHLVAVHGNHRRD